MIEHEIAEMDYETQAVPPNVEPQFQPEEISVLQPPPTYRGTVSLVAYPTGKNS